jgi:AbiJ N-terminal domain 4
MGFFTDRNFGRRARVLTEMEEPLREAIVSITRNRATDGWFGLDYPEQCPDDRGVTGTNIAALRAALVAHNLHNPFQRDAGLPTTYELLDLIEFAYEKIVQPMRRGDLHDYFGHYHLDFDRDAGRNAFRQEINLIFERNGVAYELREAGQIDRVAPEGLREPLSQAVFQTGDGTLDELLERARTKFLSRDPATRRESLETLWDAWERLKSLEDANNKREGTRRILDRAANEPNFRGMLEAEARALTEIGNDYMIRHAEVNKIPINDDEHVDFLFHRLFATIRLLLRKSNRGG